MAPFFISAIAYAENAVGVCGPVGCGQSPKQVERLLITKPGVCENFLVDSHWAGGNRGKIAADDVTLRNCEIRNVTGNGVGVFGRNVIIENCKIHHLLNSTLADQHDAHGITGRWYNVTIRNGEIFYVSGDCVQFDPDRKSTGEVFEKQVDITTWFELSKPDTYKIDGRFEMEINAGTGGCYPIDWGNVAQATTRAVVAEPGGVGSGAKEGAGEESEDERAEVPSKVTVRTENPKLDASLKKLVADALAPLTELEKRAAVFALRLLPDAKRSG